MKLSEAKASLDKVIDKARVHLYKPIQIAEILNRDRTEGDIRLNDVETYRTISRRWRDAICMDFLGRTSTSSARYQDDVFNDNAVPPEALVILGKENRKKNGIVEAYIYKKFKDRFLQLSSGLEYCSSHDKTTFQLNEFIANFWNEPGLRRSIDKVYEIIVYSIFTAIIEYLDLKIDVYVDPSKLKQIEEFNGFIKKVLGFSDGIPRITLNGRINRVGVTNAADRGLDMWANFGLAIQVKHLSLTEELAENIVNSVSSDRIIIICKDGEERLILSLLNQIGWKSKIQSVVVESELISWYETGLRGKLSNSIGNNILNYLKSEIEVEFPSTNTKEFNKFIKARKYETITDKYWL